MFFWRIEGLKRELRAGTTSRAAAAGYLGATLALYTAFPPSIWSEGYDPEWWFLQGLNVAALCIGTYLSYRLNGGASGVDFLVRYLSIAWVMTIRFTALICPVFLLIFATAAVMDAEANEPVSLWMIRALSLFPIALYARIAAHVRDVAAAGGDPFDVAAIDRSPDQR